MLKRKLCHHAFQYVTKTDPEPIKSAGHPPEVERPRTERASTSRRRSRGASRFMADGTEPLDPLSHVRGIRDGWGAPKLLKNGQKGLVNIRKKITAASRPVREGMGGGNLAVSIRTDATFRLLAAPLRREASPPFQR